MRAKSLQSCLTVCHPMDGSLPGFSVHEILQARILEWVAMPSSRGSSWTRDRTRISYVSRTSRQVFFTTSSTWLYTAVAKSLQSCLTLCDPIDGSPPGAPVPGILQARTLEWVALSFSNAWKWKVKVKSLSRIRLLTTPWTAAYQAPPSMGFSRQEYWNGVPLPSPGYTQGPYIHTLRKAGECLLNHSYLPSKKNVISFPVYLRKVRIAPAHPGCPPLP